MVTRKQRSLIESFSMEHPMIPRKCRMFFTTLTTSREWKSGKEEDAA